MASVEEKRARLRQAIAERQGKERKHAFSSIYSSSGAAATQCLSFAQNRLWLLDQISPGQNQYNIPVIVKLSGALNAAALGRALDTIVLRHTVLRTVFVTDGDEGARPVVQNVEKLPLTFLDLGGAEDSRQQVDLEAAIRDEISAGFDLSTDLMLRGKLLRLRDDCHFLLLTVHHIACDGWSIAVLTEELGALYRAYDQGKDSPLAPLELQYSDFAIWQREQLQGDLLARKLAFWKQELEGLAPVHQLPLDFPRPAVASFRGANFTQHLDVQRLTELQAFAKAQGVTLYMLLYTAFACLVARYSGEDDVVIGSPIANREQAELAPLVGFFVNTLALRTQVGDDPSFVELLARNRARILAAFENQQLPFEKLVEELKIERSLSHNPLFQIMFSLQNNEQKALAFGAIALEIIQPEWSVAKFDLNLTAMETGDGLVLCWEYATDIFTEDTIHRMAACYGVLLDSILTAPNTVVSRLALITEAEQARCIEAASYRRDDTVEDACLHRLFEQQAHCHADAIAVVFNEQTLTYRELDRRANRIAHYLVAHGVGPDDRVGVCLERSLDLVVAIVAILKAGAAYVPYDTDYTDEVIAQRVATTAPRWVLAASSTRHHFGAVPVLELDGEAYRDFPDTAPCVVSESAHLAYVLSTSGSTGEPKMIGMPHRPLVNLLRTMHWDAPALAEPVTTLQFASIGFDMSFVEIFLPLLHGGKVVLVDAETRLDLGRLLSVIQQQAISVLNLPYSLLQAIASEVIAREFVLDAVQVILSTAEQLKITPQIRAFFRRHPHIRLVNHYGPSETHVCTAYALPDDSDEWPELPSIGQPIANVSGHVLDAHLRPVPVGVVGELYVGGVGLARGYLQREDLTQRAFLPDPFRLESEARLYKTGDRVRYRSDGTLEYLGRRDTQVKLRGFRIELGAIESALSGHEAVRDVCVLVDETSQQLVAFVVATEDPQLGQALRHYLKPLLPDYMIPAAIVVLEKLPLNSNGKVDRAALKQWDLSDLLASGYVAPTNETETELCALWQRLLGRERIGVNDNFFASGGHSLLATRLVAEINAQWHVQLKVSRVFSLQTVREQATHIREAKRTIVQKINPRTEREVSPLSFAQQRLWLIDQIEEASNKYNLSAAFVLDGKLDLVALESAITAVVARHEVLRSVYAKNENGQVVQVLLPADRVEIEYADITDLDEGERQETLRRLIGEASQKPFDLARDRMLRCQATRVSDDCHVLLVTMHHIVADGWSMPILVGELNEHYSAYVEGRACILPELKIQYSDYAAWQEQANGDELEAQLAYWRQQLHGLPTVHGLPLDRPRKPAFASQSRQITHTLDVSLVEALKQLAQSRGATLFMALNAAFACLMHRYSGEKDIVVGSPIANRERPEVVNLIGFFVNTLVLRTRFEGDPDFHRLLDDTRQTLLEAYDHQRAPFEHVVEALNPERSLSHTPLFQVMLALQNNAASNFSLPGLTLSPMADGLANQVAKCDLTVNMVESDQGLCVAWEYAVDIFDATTVQRMSEHFTNLLESIVRSPSAPISRLPYLSSDEARQALINWCAKGRNYDAELTLAQLFEQQVKASPDSIALRLNKQVVTYSSLNRQANRLARMLLHKGVATETLVGVCMHRSPEMIVAILATLKAGAAYVPLDPSYPTERLRSMVEVGELPVILTTSNTESVLDGISCMRIDVGDKEQFRGHSEQDLSPGDVGATPNSLAYVCFTSGSTGRPKGVMIEQRSVASLVKSGAFVEFSEKTRTLQIASVSFDAATFEIWAPLLNGGELVLYPEEKIDIDLMNDQIAKYAVNTVFFTASLFDQWSQDLPQHSPLRFLLAGGDVISPEAVQRVYARLPEVQVVNGYGPTETTTFCGCYPVPRDEDFSRTIAISARTHSAPADETGAGAHAGLIVLDANLEPVPTGVIGELYVAGTGLTRGYLGQPRLTSEKLIANPFPDLAVEHLYRTGDMVRWRNDGTLEFIGRADGQVKIRGFRIELPEVELALHRDEAVRDAAVIVKEMPRRLVAYVCLDRHAVGQGQSDAEVVNVLRARLRQRIPDYMVPASFYVMEQLPLNENHKIDRRRLASLVLPELSSSDYEAPQTVTQMALTAIWGEVLGLEKVGIHDKFFDIGGNSLSATKMVSKARVAFGVELPLRTAFECQTVFELSQVIERATPGGVQEVIAIQAMSNRPLSFSQNRLWLIDQITPNSIQYNMPIALLMEGELNLDALQHALNSILQRHEILRTTYEAISDQDVRQVIRDAAGLPLEIVDLSSLCESERYERLDFITQQEVNTPFKLISDLMLRARLIKLDTHRHALLMTMHHIASDGWSLGVLTNELGILYRDFLHGSSSLKPLELQYSDYAIWQREQLQGDLLARKLAFWKQELEGLAPVHQLPLDFPRPAVASFRGANFTQHLDVQRLTELQAFAKAQGVTLYMLLYTAFACLVARYSGEDDVVIGSPIANREQAELAPLVGFFVNTLALRTQVGDDPSFVELLARNRARILAAFENQQLPFEKLVEELKIERSLSHNPLFQIMFSLQNNDRGKLELPGLNLRLLDQHWPIAKFDLNVNATELDSGLDIGWEYATDIFTEDTIHRMAACYGVLLDSILTAPNTVVSRLALITEAEQARCIEAASYRRDDTVEDACLHRLFEQQAHCHADAIAVVFNEQTLTYRELDRRANRIAHYLVAHGIGPDDLVGVCLERSLDLVVAIVAILKAGAAYVPYDTDYTDEVIAQRVVTTAPRWVLAASSTRHHFGAVPVLELDGEAYRDFPDTAPCVVSESTHLAYVLSTSGSTGEPKMIGMPHRPLVNLLRTMHWDAPVLAEPVTTLQFASIGFDMSFVEIFLPLLHGGKVVLVDAETRLDLGRLLSVIQQQAISMLYLPYSLLQALASEVIARELVLDGVQAIVSSAEQLKITPQVRAFFRRHPHIRLVNQYGPSETHVCTAYALPDDSEEWPELPSIGRPIANVSGHVLDAHLRPVPVGVVGELYVGGVGLARGYLQREDLTQRAFLPDPFRLESEARLYKTGDRVRYRPDGTLEYLGRRDMQVKLRGFRIELGAIESALSGHEAVRDVCVLVDETSQQLVAFVVATEDAQLGQALRHYLKPLLPDYMIPAAIVVLEMLPLNSNGKVDRAALKQWDLSDLLASGYVAPTNETETELCALWQRLLGRERIGVNDNFFASGGHSLLATRLVAEIQSRWAIELAIKTAFEYQTVRELATLIDEEAKLRTLTSSATNRMDTEEKEIWEI